MAEGSSDADAVSAMNAETQVDESKFSNADSDKQAEESDAVHMIQNPSPGLKTFPSGQSNCCQRHIKNFTYDQLNYWSGSEER